VVYTPTGSKAYGREHPAYAIVGVWLLYLYLVYDNVTYTYKRVPRADVEYG